VDDDGSDDPEVIELRRQIAALVDLIARVEAERAAAA